jgi:type I site-specific restriction-modification system R (restriction) subunit
MRAYISGYQDGDVRGSALVHMPTGSGKTGVIAALARCIPEVSSVLVLTPRIALREQLLRDIRERFFNRLERRPQLDLLPKEVIELVGPFGNLEFEVFDNTVFISTVQKLQSMSRRNREQFDYLSQNVSLVIFDEGHYEPERYLLSWTVGTSVGEAEVMRLRNGYALEMEMVARYGIGCVQLFDIRWLNVKFGCS